MSKPRFIRSSQEDIKSGKNEYNLLTTISNSVVNLNNVFTMRKDTSTNGLYLNKPSSPHQTEYKDAYTITFTTMALTEKYGTLTTTWFYLNELMRDSDYGRILELFEVKL